MSGHRDNAAARGQEWFGGGDVLDRLVQVELERDALLAENERLHQALAEIHQYTVEPRWTQEERLKAIRDVVARAES